MKLNLSDMAKVMLDFSNLMRYWGSCEPEEADRYKEEFNQILNGIDKFLMKLNSDLE
jgi:hypothetical protein